MCGIGGIFRPRFFISRNSRIMSIPTYAQRNALLPTLGFPTYADYLSSALWAEIRDAILDRDNGRCRVCKEKAQAVHHLDYSELTLRGETLDQLIAICYNCHNKVEFKDNGEKRTLFGVMLFCKKLFKKKKTEPPKRKCKMCKKNIAKMNSKMCRPCMKRRCSRPKMTRNQNDSLRQSHSDTLRTTDLNDRTILGRCPR